MWLPLLGLFTGFLIGQILNLSFPLDYAKYFSVALLAALDSIFGGIKGVLKDTYDGSILISGFFFNTLLAGTLAYLGDRIGVDLYYAAIFAFGVRIFQNLAIIRRLLLEKYRGHRSPKPDGEEEGGL